jgi:hypothetical protein
LLLLLLLREMKRWLPPPACCDCAWVERGVFDSNFANY